MRQMKTKTGTILIAAGLVLILAALLLTVYNLWDEYRAQLAADSAAAQLAQVIAGGAQGGEISTGGVSAENGTQDAADSAEGDFPVQSLLPPGQTPAYILNPGMEMPIQTIDGWDYVGLIELPEYELSLPVITPWSYDALKIAPCRYSGSAYTDDMIIAGHNYKSYFRSLQYLTEGDTVIFTDIDGNVFTYTVVEYEILAPTAVEELEGGQWDLTLFTCTRGARNRIVIRCERV